MIVEYSSLPDSDTISIGLLGLTFLVFLDLIVIGRCWWAGFRNRRFREALVMTAVLTVGGLLAIGVLGGFVWSLHGLVTQIFPRHPWAKALLRVCFWAWVSFSWIGMRRAHRGESGPLDRPS